MSSIEQLYPINGGATAALILVRWTSVIEADTISGHVRLAPGAKIAAGLQEHREKAKLVRIAS
jgi:hypothetical protein